MDRMVRLDDDTDLALDKLKHEVLIKTGKRLYKKQIANWIISNVFSCRDNQCEVTFWKWVESL